MDLKKSSLVIVGVGLLFVLLGDRILPAPIATYSLQARTGLNRVLMGLLPQIKSQNRDAKTEEAVDALYKNK